MPDTRRNLQINQPGIQGNKEVDQNGWPVPLSDPSDPLRMVVTSGSNGSQRNFDPVATSVQNELSLAEGRPNGGATNTEQGPHSNKLKTSQQNAGDHHTPESN